MLCGAPTSKSKGMPLRLTRSQVATDGLHPLSASLMFARNANSVERLTGLKQDRPLVVAEHHHARITAVFLNWLARHEIFIATLEPVLGRRMRVIQRALHALGEERRASNLSN